jgi:hypothetical protein
MLEGAYVREQSQSLFTRWVGSIIGEYRLESILGQSALGPIFAAQHVETQAPAFLRVLAVPPASTAEMVAIYERTMAHQAGHIASLRHPYILPLISYGLWQGLPYLVWPFPAMRSLTTRLTQSGPLDVVTVGRYVDQLAGALEYAHEHATIHRNLSTDCIYLQLDGQPVVADFGARRLYELLNASGDATPQYYGSAEAYAPEQLLGRPADTYTDVYALGAVTYRLLTGQSPFAADSFEALVQRHLRTDPLPLAQARAALPAALDSVLSTAMAKDPAQRFQHPGEFADAYHRVIDTASSRRVPFAATADGYGTPAAQSASAGHDGWGGSATAGREQARGARSTPPARHISTPAPGDAPFAARNPASRGRIGVATLLLVVLIGGGLALALSRHSATATISGVVTFVDSGSVPTGVTDTIQVNVHGLAAPATGTHYQAWLINQSTEQILALGSLVARPQQAYTLSYSVARGSGSQPQNILAVGNTFEITLEKVNVPAPSGQVLLSASFPPDAFIHIKHVMVSFPTTPRTIGLLVGVLQQTRAANNEAQALQQAAATGQTSLVQCHAQNILNILEGTQGQHYHALSPNCAALGVTTKADGFGLLESSTATQYGQDAAPTGYIAGAADHASLAATTPDATALVRQHGAQVQEALADVKTSLAAADQDAQHMLATPTDIAAAAALAGDCTHAYGTVGAPGRATASGALGAYLQGQLMASLPLS